jgi:hypothetical protein
MMAIWDGTGTWLSSNLIAPTKEITGLLFATDANSWTVGGSPVIFFIIEFGK